MITSKICNICGKKAVLRDEFTILSMLYQNFTCGHTQIVKKVESSDFSHMTSTDGKKLFPFQIAGATWAMNSNGRFLIMDEMGLGKTVQFLAVAGALQKTKFLLIGKAGLKQQWAQETYRWLNESLTQIIEAENEYLLPGVKGYIISYDLLWRFKDIPAFVRRLGVNLIGLDEVQHLKNTDTKRTNGVRLACGQVDYIGALSGMPIEKHAGELFPILNILHPEKFPTRHQYETVWVDTYFNGRTLKHAGLKDHKRFKEYTKDFIIRRTRAEVLPDLPKINRDYRFTDLSSEVEQEYIDEVKKLKENYTGIVDENIMAYLSRMRHITGRAKIDVTVDFVSDFIEETDRKIAVFVHHKDVAYQLFQRLKVLQLQDLNYGADILSLTSDLSSAGRDEVVKNFWRDDYRILIASTLASGEGLNLQCGADMVLHERQWNPAKEEQVEGRFARIGRPEKLVAEMGDKVNAMYPIAVGTIDEFFCKIVEQKRSACLNTLDGTEIAWDQTSIMQELAEVISINGGKRWGF